MPATLTLVSDPSALGGGSTLLIGRRDRLRADDMMAYLPQGLNPTWHAMIKRADPGDTGRLETTHVGEKATRVCAGVLPEVCSRHNSPSRAWAIPALVRSGAVGTVFAPTCLRTDPSDWHSPAKFIVGIRRDTQKGS